MGDTGSETLSFSFHDTQQVIVLTGYNTTMIDLHDTVDFGCYHVCRLHTPLLYYYNSMSIGEGP